MPQAVSCCPKAYILLHNINNSFIIRNFWINLDSFAWMHHLAM